MLIDVNNCNFYSNIRRKYNDAVSCRGRIIYITQGLFQFKWQRGEISVGAA